MDQVFVISVQKWYQQYHAGGIHLVAVVHTREEVLQVLENISADYPVLNIRHNFTMPQFNNEQWIAEVELLPGDIRTIAVSGIMDPDPGYGADFPYNL